MRSQKKSIMRKETIIKMFNRRGYQLTKVGSHWSVTPPYGGSSRLFDTLHQASRYYFYTGY